MHPGFLQGAWRVVPSSMHWAGSSLSRMIIPSRSQFHHWTWFVLYYHFVYYWVTHLALFSRGNLAYFRGPGESLVGFSELLWRDLFPPTSDYDSRGQVSSCIEISIPALYQDIISICNSVDWIVIRPGCENIGNLEIRGTNPSCHHPSHMGISRDNGNKSVEVS